MKKLNKKYFIGLSSFCVLFLVALFLFFQCAPGENLSALSISQLQEQIKLLQKQAEDIMAMLGILEKEEAGKIETTIPAEPDIIPPVLANLEPEQITDTSTVIFWETDELSNGRVVYSVQYHKNNEKMNNSKMEAVNPELTVAHKVKLESLKPNTKYYYFISSTDPSGNTSVSNTHSVTTQKPR